MNKTTFKKFLLILFIVQALYDLLILPLSLLSPLSSELTALIPVSLPTFILFNITYGLFVFIAAMGLYKQKKWVGFILLWGYPLFPLFSLVAVHGFSLTPFAPFIYIVIWITYRSEVFTRLNRNETADSTEETATGIDILIDDEFKSESSDKSTSGPSYKRMAGIVSLILGGYMLLSLLSSISMISLENLSPVTGALFTLSIYLLLTYLGIYLIGKEQKKELIARQLLITGVIGIIIGLSLLTVLNTPEVEQLNDMTGGVITSKYGIMMILFSLFLLSIAIPLKRNNI